MNNELNKVKDDIKGIKTDYATKTELTTKVGTV